MWLLDFWKICTPLLKAYTVADDTADYKNFRLFWCRHTINVNTLHCSSTTEKMQPTTSSETSVTIIVHRVISQKIWKFYKHYWENPKSRSISTTRPEHVTSTESMNYYTTHPANIVLFCSFTITNLRISESFYYNITIQHDTVQPNLVKTTSVYTTPRL
jgi:hypothetical protein